RASGSVAVVAQQVAVGPSCPALDRFEGEWRDDGEPATRFGHQVGEREELAPALRSAWGARRPIEPFEARTYHGVRTESPVAQSFNPLDQPTDKELAQI